MHTNLSEMVQTVVTLTTIDTSKHEKGAMQHAHPVRTRHGAGAHADSGARTWNEVW